MEIFPNPPFAALMTLPFVVAFFGLHFVLFKPLFAYLEERTKVSEAARSEAGTLKADVSQKLAEVDRRLNDVRQEIVALRSTRRGKALAEEAVILAEDRKLADAAVTEAVARVAGERHTASAELKTTTAMLAGEISSQVLGRQVS